MSPLFDGSMAIAVVFAFALACVFTFVGGAVDGTHAVKGAVMARALAPWKAATLTAICHFVGVYIGGTAVVRAWQTFVSFESIAAAGAPVALAAPIAAIGAALVWCVVARSLSLPVSSTLALFGALLGAGAASALSMHGAWESVVRLERAGALVLGMLGVPLSAFVVATVGGRVAEGWRRSRALADSPASSPRFARGSVIGAAAASSFAHGMMGGQRGVAAIMIAAIAIAPADFALNRDLSREGIVAAVVATRPIEASVLAAYGEDRPLQAANGAIVPPPSRAGAIASELEDVRAALDGKGSLDAIRADERVALRRRILHLDEEIGAVLALDEPSLTPTQRATITMQREALRAVIASTPSWTFVVIALALGLGALASWQRLGALRAERAGEAPLDTSNTIAADLATAIALSTAAFTGIVVDAGDAASAALAGATLGSGSRAQRSAAREVAFGWLVSLPVSIIFGGLLFLLFQTVGAPGAVSTP